MRHPHTSSDGKAPHEHRDDRDVIQDVGPGARADAGRDRGDAHQRPEQRKSLREQAGGACPCRPGPSDRRSSDQDGGDDAFGDARLPVFVAADEPAGMNCRGGNERGSFDE